GARQCAGQGAAAAAAPTVARGVAARQRAAEAAAGGGRAGERARGRSRRRRRAVGGTFVERAATGVLGLRERIAAGLLARGPIGVTSARRGARLQRGLRLGETDATRGGTATPVTSKAEPIMMNVNHRVVIVGVPPLDARLHPTAFGGNTFSRAATVISARPARRSLVCNGGRPEGPQRAP